MMNRYFLKNLHYRILNLWPFALWIGITCLAVYLIFKADDRAPLSGYYECDKTTLSLVERGELKDVYIAVGDRVEEGDILLGFNTDLVESKIRAEKRKIELQERDRLRRQLSDFQDIDVQIQEWGLKLKETETELFHVSEELDRIQPLFSKQLIEPGEYWRVKARHEELQISAKEIPELIGNLKSNRQQLSEIVAELEETTESNVTSPEIDLLEKQRDQMSLRANRAGVVSKILLQEGEVLMPGDTAIEIVHSDSSRVVGFVPVAFVDRLTAGDVVEVSSVARTWAAIEGRVESISPIVTPKYEATNQPSELGCWFFVTLDEEHDVMIGESVSIRYGPESSWLQKLLGGH
ncbi:HlyD family efflux transporter periplasmic adaptor subunit [Puniceicoccaceae bacterium K14]|nr:HlyD family efflux transporter periplasmic adaptor subunit [Puniceicoccaceae bacterium K14]